LRAKECALHGTQETQVPPDNRHSLRDGVNGCSALSPEFRAC
jgi:hypothetical protein